MGFGYFYQIYKFCGLFKQVKWSIQPHIDVVATWLRTRFQKKAQ